VTSGETLPSKEDLAKPGFTEKAVAAVDHGSTLETQHYQNRIRNS
jgi:hypothetical protein